MRRAPQPAKYWVCRWRAQYELWLDREADSRQSVCMRRLLGARSSPGHEQRPWGSECCARSGRHRHCSRSVPDESRSLSAGTVGAKLCCVLLVVQHVQVYVHNALHGTLVEREQGVVGNTLKHGRRSGCGCSQGQRSSRYTGLPGSTGSSRSEDWTASPAQQRTALHHPMTRLVSGETLTARHWADTQGGQLMAHCFCGSRHCCHRASCGRAEHTVEQVVCTAI